MKDHLTQNDIDAKIKDAKFTVLEDGRTTICNLYLENGFTVRGESACVSKDNFNKDIGEQIALENAKNKVQELEGYLLAENIYHSKQTSCADKLKQFNKPGTLFGITRS